MLAEALRSHTKADLLSSAPPSVLAETLPPNEETVTRGRHVMARQASTTPGSELYCLIYCPLARVSAAARARSSSSWCFASRATSAAVSACLAAKRSSAL